MSTFNRTPRASAKWYDVPAKTPSAECRGKDCGDPIYWIENPRMHGGRLPIDCDVDGGQEPYAGDDPRQMNLLGDAPRPSCNGRGVLHFETCPNAGEF